MLARVVENPEERMLNWGREPGSLPSRGLVQVEHEGVQIRECVDFEGPRALGSRAVTLLERDMVERGFPRGDLEPKAAACEEFVADGFAAGQSDAEYVRILVNDG